MGFVEDKINLVRGLLFPKKLRVILLHKSDYEVFVFKTKDIKNSEVKLNGKTYIIKDDYYYYGKNFDLCIILNGTLVSTTRKQIVNFVNIDFNKLKLTKKTLEDYDNETLEKYNDTNVLKMLLEAVKPDTNYTPYIIAGCVLVAVFILAKAMKWI